MSSLSGPPPPPPPPNNTTTTKPTFRRFAASLDMYRKVPTDLLEGTKRGAITSYIALFTILTLFTFETWAYINSTEIISDLSLDAPTTTTRNNHKVRINFNITMMDLKCEHTVIDIVSILNTNQNITQHVTKRTLDSDGVKERFVHRNRKQDDILLQDERVQESLEDLVEMKGGEEDALSLDGDTLEFARHEFQFLFVDFYASWCSHCKALAPTWEILAEVMMAAAAEHVEGGDEEHDYSHEDYENALKVAQPVQIAKVDCVEHKELCAEQEIRGYPTLRLFVDGEHQSDYVGHRTVIEFTNWLTKVEEEYNEENELLDTPQTKKQSASISSAHEVAREYLDINETRTEMNTFPKRHPYIEPNSPEEAQWRQKIRIHQSRQQSTWDESEHTGCELSGFLMVDRAPGHFHIQARSPHHDIAAHMTNVSHEVHHLSFGEMGVIRAIERGETITPMGLHRAVHPMDENVYVTHHEHEAFHHYLKVITTDFENPYVDGVVRGSYGRRAYQILQSSQLSLFPNDVVPAAKFSFDLSPISVTYRETSRAWYDYVTSIMAIVGGTFTVFGMVESGVGRVMRQVSKPRGLMDGM